MPIYFFGHSLDVSDKDIIANLLSKDNPITIYYTDDNDRNMKIKNVISLIGKEQAIIKINSGDIVFKAI